MIDGIKNLLLSKEYNEYRTGIELIKHYEMTKELSENEVFDLILWGKRRMSYYDRYHKMSAELVSHRNVKFTLYVINNCQKEYMKEQFAHHSSFYYDAKISGNLFLHILDSFVGNGRRNLIFQINTSGGSTLFGTSVNYHKSNEDKAIGKFKQRCLKLLSKVNENNGKVLEYDWINYTFK